MECPICGSKSISTFFNYPRFTLKACPDCDMLFQPEESRSKSSDLIPEIYNEGWIRMRDQWIKSSYLDNAYFNTLMLQMYKPNKGKLLEIGSGTGEFLNMARAAGWDTLGVEPSAASCAYIAEKYQLPIIEGIWTPDLPLPIETFDAVAFWHVFEHIPDPVSFLKQLSSLLTKESYIFFSVPNRYSLRNEVFGISSSLYTEADHLFHHSERSLRRIVEKAGLDVQALFSKQTTAELERLLPHYRPNVSFTFAQTMELLSQLQGEMRGHELFCVAKKSAE